jgi:tRNA 5-methylaminomethyl-2-thiouridine biosynthesis bifunctional protein
MSGERDPQLIWTEAGEPRSGRFGDVYFSAEDGLAESRAVFLQGCGLPDAWAGRGRFTVAELGFGTGLNIIALLDLWSGTRPDGARLNIFSIEGFPLAREEAARALSRWPEVRPVVDLLIQRWPSSTPGFHRVDLPELNAVLDLAVGDAAWALDQWTGQADAWFLDGFAPSTNPGMWSGAVLDGVRARSAPDARLATFTVAGAVRRGLTERGFAVDKRPGHGRKRERLEARGTGALAPQARRPAVAVIGAGIAGAALVRAFAGMGVHATVVEAERDGAGASGFPAALVTPRLDAGDGAIAALYAQALERAGVLYDAIPGAVLARGVLQLEQAARDATRFEKIRDQPLWPRGAMRGLHAAACGERLGEPVGTGGLSMADALAVHPQSILTAWLAEAERVTATVAGLKLQAGGWSLLDMSGDVVLRADIVVLAGGWGNAALAPDLSLAPVRGQADWIEGISVAPVAWGGYAVPTGSGLLFGATHDRGESSGTGRAEASARNLATVAGRLPALAARIAAAGPSRARTAIRATTPDRLPLAGAVPGAPGLFLLGGLGSRGFCVAPLLADHVAALALQAPSPLPGDLADRVEPSRRTTRGGCNVRHRVAP